MFQKVALEITPFFLGGGFKIRTWLKSWNQQLVLFQTKNLELIPKMKNGVNNNTPFS